MSSTIAELKISIAAATGIPTPKQRLVHGLKELTDTEMVDALTPDADHGVDLDLVQRTTEQLAWLQELRARDGWAAYWWLQRAAEEVKADREVILAAVSKLGIQARKVLQLAPEGLRADREVVLQAVSRDGKALQYASEDLRGDHEVVLIAVAQNPLAWHCANPECRPRQPAKVHRRGRGHGIASHAKRS